MTSYGHKGGYPTKTNESPRKGGSPGNTPHASDVKKAINVFAPPSPRLAQGTRKESLTADSKLSPCPAFESRAAKPHDVL